jgi:spore coat protein U-like protein
MVLTTKNYTVYGRIPSVQVVPAGTYGDTIVVTISY